MSKETKGQKGWTKPEIKRLGTIKDVAGAESPRAQGATGKKS